MLKGAKLYTISFENPPDTLRLINLDFLISKERLY